MTTILNRRGASRARACAKLLAAAACVALAGCPLMQNANVSVTGLHQPIGGTLTGLAASDSLVLQDNGGDNLILSANGTFAFATGLTQGTGYNVTILSPPLNQKCVVGNGSGTVATSPITSVTVTCVMDIPGSPSSSLTSSLVGNYKWIVENVASGTGGLVSGAFDGVGGYTGSAIYNAGGTISTGVAQEGIYSVAQDATMTAADGGGGIFNGATVMATYNAFVLVDLAAGQQPRLVLGVKPNAAGSQSVASLQGNYAGADLEVDPNGAGSTGSVSTLAFDGAGNITGSQTTNRSGTISGPTAVSQTYAVAADGTVTVGNGADTGAFTADGTLLVFADLKSGDPADVGAYVKVGSSESAATLSGTYTIAVLQNNDPGDDGFLTTAVFDGNGNFTGTQTENNAGTITSGTAVSGTYTVAPNGALTISVNGHPAWATGALSADGRAFVAGHVVSGSVPILGIGLKQF